MKWSFCENLSSSSVDFTEFMKLCLLQLPRGSSSMYELTFVSWKGLHIWFENERMLHVCCCIIKGFIFSVSCAANLWFDFSISFLYRIMRSWRNDVIMAKILNEILNSFESLWEIDILSFFLSSFIAGNPPGNPQRLSIRL